MKLTDLEPSFLRITSENSYQMDVPFADAQGVMFLCPACWTANGGAVGTHSVICWFRDRGVADTMSPGPARWPATGTGLDDLTLTPSVLLTSGCRWHGFVTAGQVTSC